MFVYYSWLFTAHICLLHMIVYYTCFSATHVCLLHLGDEVLLMKLKTSKFIQSFLVTGTPPLVWGHLSKTHAPEKENQDFKVFFFVCIQMIFYNCFILIIAKLSLNFNFDKSLAEVALRSIHPTTHPLHPPDRKSIIRDQKLSQN